MMADAKAIPEQYGSVTAQLLFDETAAAIDFYKKALGAEEIIRIEGPGGSIMHAELKIGDTIVMMNDLFQGMEGVGSPKKLGGVSAMIYLYVQDVDAAHKRAIDAGAVASGPLMDMFWGDRTGQITDPFGHKWTLATHVKDVSPEEMEEAHKEMTARMKPAG